MKQNKNTYKLFGGLGLALLGIVVIFAWSNLKYDKKITEESEKPRVIATFFPLYDFTKEIAGDNVVIDILFTQTPEVSSFSPGDIKKINGADLIVKNGAGLEPILDELVGASDNKNVRVVDTSEGVGFMENPEKIEIETDEEFVGEHEEHGPVDPHIWLNPRNAIIQVGNIRDALIDLDPENARFYTDNAASYISELSQLDSELETEISVLGKKDFIAFHSAFQYFSQRYGLNQVAIIEEFPGKEPSPRYIGELIEIIKESETTVIFSEPQFSPRIVEALAGDLDLKVYSLNPIETGDIRKDSYVKIMRENLSTLKEALK